MSHTPGPWNVIADLDKVGENWSVCWTGHYAIETDGLKADEIGDEHDDAHLIAAAPDMYTALLAVLHPAGDTPDEVRAQVKAALEKAAPRWPE